MPVSQAQICFVFLNTAKQMTQISGIYDKHSLKDAIVFWRLL